MKQTAEKFPVLKILNLQGSNDQKIYKDLKRGKVINGITLQYDATQIKQYLKWIIVRKASNVGFLGVVKIINPGLSPVEYKFRTLKTISISIPQRDFQTGFLWVEHSVAEEVWIF